MQLFNLAILSFFGLAVAAPHRTTTTVHIVNKCKSTIQLGQLTNNQKSGNPTPIASGHQKSYHFTGAWSGRFWARENCHGSSCQIAGAAFPASLVEFTFNGDAGKDFYDISFVDGYNLSVSITPVHPQNKNKESGKFWCGTPTCRQAPKCPQELQLIVDGVYVGCQSACSKFGNPEYCCSGEFDTPEKCPINKYAAIVKKGCPDAYSYAYDDKDSLYQCVSSAYTVTWCPN